MRMTTKGRYAVMAMADLAAYATDRPIALVGIAERQNISLSYLEQLFGRLRRGGLVKSVRGPGGGYMLSRRACDIRISDIILAVDEQIQTCRCVQEGLPAGCQQDQGRCLTHDLWDELANQIHLFLNRLSLADVVERRVLGSSGLPPRLHPGAHAFPETRTNRTG